LGYRDRNIPPTKGTELHQQQKQKQKHDLQKEVLSSLFNYQGHSDVEEAPKRIVKDVNMKSRFGHVVFEPPKDSPEEFNIDMDFSQPEDIDGTSCYSGKMYSYFLLFVISSLIYLRDFCKSRFVSKFYFITIYILYKSKDIFHFQKMYFYDAIAIPCMCFLSQRIIAS